MSVLSIDEIVDRLYRTDPKDSQRIFVVPTPKCEDIKESSLDLMLGNHFTVTKTARFSGLAARSDTGEKDIASYQERVMIPFDKELFIHPGTFILGVTWQYICLPDNVSAQVVARSTWGRAGLTVATAVAVHPGFTGCLTLELVNNGNAPIALYLGARIAQIIFEHLEPRDNLQTCKVSKYFGLTEPGFTKLHDERIELNKWRKVGKRISFQNETS